MSDRTLTSNDTPQDSSNPTRGHLGWRVLKFGGSSVRDADRIRAVAELIERARARADRVAVVVSALGGTTDELLGLVRQRNRIDPLKAIADRHRTAAEDINDPDAAADVARLLVDLSSFVEQLPLAPAAVTLEQTDLLMSFGERLSAPLVAGALRQRGVAADPCDMRALIATSERFSRARVDETASFEAIEQHFNQSEPIQVATGFLGAARDGRTTTLGRGGSDLTAALLGAALDAAEIEIWTDVDGVLSADPRVVADAQSIDRLSYEEIMELAHFGAKVLYPPTVTPARARNIPIRILNTLNPAFAGTLIGPTAATSKTSPGWLGDASQPTDRADSSRPFTGITAVNPVALLTLVGTGMVGVTGTAHRFFGALASVDCSAILISQASSEHSICAAIPPERAERAREAVDREFDRELRARLVQPAEIEPDLSVVAVVGAGMRERPGVAAEVFGVLGKRGINIRAIAQGSSELNISVAVKQTDRVATVQALHAALFQSSATASSAVDRQPMPAATTERQTLDVVVAGVGGVGKELLEMVQQSGRLRLAGVINSSRQWLAAETAIGSILHGGETLHSEGWRERLARAQPNEPTHLLQWLKERQATARPLAFVDCTASSTVAKLYPEIGATQTHIVAANKIGLTFDQTDTAALSWSQGTPATSASVLYEATVGAGLPVISTLRSLLAAGDKVIEISGVFSGTLGYLLAQLRAGQVPSEAIREAFNAGYTEPDPRDDLSGTDVARKLLILSRTCGASVDLNDIAVEPLVPFDPTASIDTFWQELASTDAPLQERIAAAREHGQALAYLARLRLGRRRTSEQSPIEQPRLSVGLAQVPAEHPACQLQGTDNLFVLRTARYDAQPLTIRGPGAGTAVTAAGVMADLLSLQASLPLHRSH